MSCVVEREILDNLSRAQTAAVIDNEKQTKENRRKQNATLKIYDQNMSILPSCYFKAVSLWDYYQYW